jgi:hypothetical protein
MDEQKDWAVPRFRWDRVLKTAREHPARYVFLAIVFAFLAGGNTTILLFGRHFLRYFSIALALCAVMTSFLCMFLFGYILISALRHKPNELDAGRAILRADS